MRIKNPIEKVGRATYPASSTKPNIFMESEAVYNQESRANVSKRNHLPGGFGGLVGGGYISTPSWLMSSLFYIVIMAFTTGCSSFGEQRNVEVEGENCDRLHVRLDKSTTTTEVTPQ